MILVELLRLRGTSLNYFSEAWDTLQFCQKLRAKVWSLQAAFYWTSYWRRVQFIHQAIVFLQVLYWVFMKKNLQAFASKKDFSSNFILSSEVFFCVFGFIFRFSGSFCPLKPTKELFRNYITHKSKFLYFSLPLWALRIFCTTPRFSKLKLHLFPAKTCWIEINFGSLTLNPHLLSMGRYSLLLLLLKIIIIILALLLLKTPFCKTSAGFLLKIVILHPVSQHTPGGRLR